MSIFSVRNSGALSGEVCISGSKNAVLPLLAATLLTKDSCEINDVPALMDVEVMCGLLGSFGVKVTHNKAEGFIICDPAQIDSSEAPIDLVKMMRASVFTMGPLLVRTGSARIPLPGGCAIGDRPIDQHIKGFRALGASVVIKQDENGEDYVEAMAGALEGAEIYLDTPSVGATENIMMAAALAKGYTVIENAAQEPEIVDLASFINKMGGRIKGAGTDTIKIEGVSSLHGAKHAVIPDRIEAGTFMLAAAITRGDILIKNMLPDHLMSVIAKLRECGVTVDEYEESAFVRASSCDLIATDIKTLPYPGFPTDMQPQFMTFLSTTEGSSQIRETVFENRFMHIAELNKMGADIFAADGRRALVPGSKTLSGSVVRATDLRAGAALILAGLVADGETSVTDIYHIERGYDSIAAKLTSLGADINIAG